MVGRFDGGRVVRLRGFLGVWWIREFFPGKDVGLGA